MATHLIINPGSASKKYALYRDGALAFSAHFEGESGGRVVTLVEGEQTEKRMVAGDEYANATAYLIAEMVKRGLIGSAADIAGIGLRVVAPGSYFLENKIVDGEFIKKLGEAEEFAPLHAKASMAEVRNLAEALKNTPIVAVSDSAFHATIHGPARHYALPSDLAEQYDIMRFGYHGISFRSIVGKLEAMQAGAGRAILCHLGSGSSIAAVRDKRSVDTTMGFTPLEGLAMATRTGDIDAGAVIYLAKKTGLGLDELEAFLNEKCGLLGVSGTTGDIRDLLEREQNGDARAKLALELFVYKIKKYIGAYVAVLGGADILAFSATVGERSPIMRARICGGLDALGIVLDAAKNDATVSRDGFIHDEAKSKVKVAVVTTDEMSQMARDTAALVGK